MPSYIGFHRSLIFFTRIHHHLCRVRVFIMVKIFSKFLMKSPADQEEAASNPVRKHTKRRTSNILNKVCFVYNIQRKGKLNSYNDGGLGRCSGDAPAKNLDESMKNYPLGETHKYKEATNRLFIKLNEAAYDKFVVDPYYHEKYSVILHTNNL